ITLSLMTPYAAFLLPAHVGGSGVLATVAAGLYVSWNGPLLIPAATRLQGIFFWDLLIYLLEGVVFLITGMQLRFLIERSDPVLLHQLAIAIPLVVAVIVIARFVWSSRPSTCRAGSAKRWRGAIRRPRGSSRSWWPLRACAVSSRWRRRWPFR